MAGKEQKTFEPTFEPLEEPLGGQTRSGRRRGTSWFPLNMTVNQQEHAQNLIDMSRAWQATRGSLEQCQYQTQSYTKAKQQFANILFDSFYRWMRKNIYSHNFRSYLANDWDMKENRLKSPNQPNESLFLRLTRYTEGESGENLPICAQFYIKLSQINELLRTAEHSVLKQQIRNETEFFARQFDHLYSILPAIITNVIECWKWEGDKKYHFG